MTDPSALCSSTPLFPLKGVQLPRMGERSMFNDLLEQQAVIKQLFKDQAEINRAIQEELAKEKQLTQIICYYVDKRVKMAGTETTY